MRQKGPVSRVTVTVAEGTVSPIIHVFTYMSTQTGAAQRLSRHGEQSAAGYFPTALE